MMSNHPRVIRITDKDIVEANQLSLNCPICAGSVERTAGNREMVPIFCTDCETLYHLACWEQNGAKCAVLGCAGTTYKRYGVIDLGPVLKIRRRDIPKVVPQPAVVPSGRTKRLKEAERRMQREVRQRRFWRNLWQGLLRAIRLWSSDPS